MYAGYLFEQALTSLVQIVLVPGLSIPAIIWKNVAPKLASRGFHVLLYGESHSPSWQSKLNLLDLYGRGYSDAPATIYDTKLYTTQLALLMQYLNWSKAHIVGVSMVRQTDSRVIYTFAHASL